MSEDAAVLYFKMVWVKCYIYEGEGEPDDWQESSYPILPQARPAQRETATDGQYFKLFYYYRWLKPGGYSLYSDDRDDRRIF